MITVVCSSQYPLDDFKKHVIKTSGLHNKIEFLGYENKGEFSLTQIYNRGLKEAKYNIVVYMHHDITIETNQWGKKLLKHFEKHSEYGIIGVAGTKYMSASGQWWENKKKMYGRVAHTHEGKTWLSSYSEDIGQNIEEVVVVDGVFFAVDKRKLKMEFNESVEGFHFYEITFCFENYLKGVKLGVITNIRINHKSIGMTNKSWDDNRIAFAERFKDNLPVNIKKVLLKGEKLKVLIGCLTLKGDSQEDTSTINMIEDLLKENAEITVVSNVDEKLSRILKRMGVNVFSLQEPPNFKLGDGQWKLKSVNGEIVSEPKTLYKLGEKPFNLLHLIKKPVVDHLLRLYPDTPIICSIDSSDEPVLSKQIKKYIATNDEVKNNLNEQYGVPVELVDVGGKIIEKYLEIIE